MARKKSLSALGAYKNYCQTLQKKTQKKPIDYLVLDEIYTFIGEKKNKFYVWTGIGFSSTGEKLCFFHVDSSKGLTGLLNFNKCLPLATTYYCDGNTAYPWLYGSKCIPGKGVKTNLVESLNSQIRQYVSRLKRKTKAYTKSKDALQASLALIFIGKIF